MKRASDGGMEKIAMTIAQVFSLGLFVALFVLPIGVVVAVLARLPWWSPFAIAVCAFCLVAGSLGILFTLRDRRLLWVAERRLDLDLNGDGFVGQPDKTKPRSKPSETRFAYVYGSDPRSDRYNEQRDFRFWLEKVYSGDRRTTWDDWRNVRLPSGDAMTQSRWETYCNRMLDAGLATRPHSTAPIELKGEYRTALLTFREVLG